MGGDAGIRAVRRFFGAFVTLAMVLVAATPAAGTDTTHGSLVDDTPMLDAPRFVDGEVLAGAQIGNRIIVGGSFTQVEDAQLGLVDQPHLAAYDVHTGRLDAAFSPTVDDAINAIVDSGDGMVLVVGRFRSVNGEARDRVARLRIVDGSVVEGFVANADGRVFDVAVAGDRAFLGGAFLSVNGTARSRLAAVDLHTGEVDAGFDIPVTDPTGWEGAASVRGIDVSPDQTTLASVHNDSRVGGFRRQGIALIDISGPVARVLPWRTTLYEYDCQPWFPQFPRPLMRDVQFSPDGDSVVAVSAIGNYAPGCDVAVSFPATGGAGVQPLWISRMFDSPETVTVTDAAVYVGGHMRWAMGPGTMWTQFADGNTNEQPAGTVAREQLVALSPEDGTALDWDPGAGGFRGVLSLEATEGGLLAGSDGSRFGGAEVGRHAFFALPADPPPPDGNPPVSAFVAPTNGGTAGSPLLLIVDVTDDTAVADVAVRVRDEAGGLYLQPGGGFAAAATDLSPFVIGTGTPLARATAMLELPPGTYTATATATDAAGTPEAVPAAATFSVSLGEGGGAPDGRFDHPANHEVIPGRVTLSGWAWDDGGIDKVRVIVRDLVSGEYLQNDGTFAPQFNRMWVLPERRGSSVTFFSWTAALPDGKYRAWLHLKDADGRRDPVRDRVNFRVRR